MSYVESLLSEDEEIVHTSHQHWFVVVPSLLGMAFFSLLIVALTVALVTFLAGALLPLSLAPLAFLLIPVGKVIGDLLRWRSRSLVITNRRVIHVAGVLSKNVLDSSLEKVNDVSMEQSLWGRLFDYGDLEILTASESGANRFERIAHPVTCKTAMLDQKRLVENDLPALAADIPTQIAKLAALREKGIVTDSEFDAKKAELLGRM